MKTYKITISGKEIEVTQNEDGSFNKPDIVKELEPIGTALKPAFEPICMAMKPLSEKNYVANILKYGTGGINIDESRVGIDVIPAQKRGNAVNVSFQSGGFTEEHTGRFPANLIHDGSDEVVACFPETKSVKANNVQRKDCLNTAMSGKNYARFNEEEGYNDSGNASRFFKSIPIEEQDEIQEECTSMEEKLEKLGFLPEAAKSIIYQAKASKSERNKGCEGLYILKDNIPTEDIDEIKHLLSI